MARIDEVRLMTKVARLYHEQRMRQSQIAASLHLSQSTVSRLLKRAEQEQIVRVTVSVPHGVYTDLEETLVVAECLWPSASCVSMMLPVDSLTHWAKVWRVWCRWTSPRPAHLAYVLSRLAKACPVSWSPLCSLVRSCEVHSGVSASIALKRPEVLR